MTLQKVEARSIEGQLFPLVIILPFALIALLIVMP